MAMFMRFLRFQHTLIALHECKNSMDADESLSDEESRAMVKLVKLCKQIAAEDEDQD